MFLMLYFILDGLILFHKGDFFLLCKMFLGRFFQGSIFLLLCEFIKGELYTEYVAGYLVPE